MFIPRAGAEALMPEEYQREIIQSVPEASSVMSLGRRLPDMARAQQRIPVLASLPTAYFTNPGPNAADDLNFKKTSRMLWENKYIEAEELNVIIPIPQSVLDDADYDIWAEVKPKLIEAYGVAFDQAVFYSTNAPAVWPTGIVAAANAAGNIVLVGAGADSFDDIMAAGGLISKVEEDGFMVNGFIAHMTMRARLRGLRDSVGNPIFKSLYKEGMQGATRYELDGEMVMFPRNGAIDSARSLMIAGDWNQLVYAIRKDITWKILDQAVIQDPITGEIVYNLAQMNMVALRSSMRLGWQVPNPINRINEDEDERYPFSVYRGAGS